MSKNSSEIVYPYMPAGPIFGFVDMNDPFMTEAYEYAREFSLDKIMPTASIIVSKGSVIGRGANGSTYHEQYECERVKRGIPTGQGYEVCEGCHPKNHSEVSAIADALEKSKDLEGADVYLWGHWWCCEPCWQAMTQAGIRQVYLLERSHELFNKTHPANIVGQPFNQLPT